MTQYNFTCPQTGQRWQRVHASKARKIFADGNTIKAVPNKCALFGVWMNGGFTTYKNDEDTDSADVQFDRFSNMARAQNCCAQLGYELAYYAKEETVLAKKKEFLRRPKYNKAV